jgi:hypothetical protein
LRGGGDSADFFFLAMAHWQLGHRDEARKWYVKAIEWMDNYLPGDKALRRFRAEAAELLGIAEPKSVGSQPAENKTPNTDDPAPATRGQL